MSTLGKASVPKLLLTINKLHRLQDLRQAVDKSEQLQARLLAVVQPIVRSSIARVAQPVDQSPSSPAKATLPHDPLRPIRHTTACMYEGASDSASADSTESVLDSVDEIMKVSEGALLTTRLLLRHMAEVIAFKHEVHVPVHPSVRHLHGSSTMQLKEVCPNNSCAALCKAVQPSANFGHKAPQCHASLGNTVVCLLTHQEWVHSRSHGKQGQAL